MFPTHVGMNRHDKKYQKLIPDVPHTRGDEPDGVTYQWAGAQMFPTHVGMNRYKWGVGGCIKYVPHTRGDEPIKEQSKQ